MTVLNNAFWVFYGAELPEYWSLFAKSVNPYKNFWLTILCEKSFIKPSLQNKYVSITKSERQLLVISTENILKSTFCHKPYIYEV